MRNLLECKGMSFTARINGCDVIGKIQAMHNEVFLCQNDISGTSCDDKLNYKYSWSVRSGSEDDLINDGVTNFELINDDSYNPESWKVGDMLSDGSNPFTIIFISGELIIGKFPNGRATCSYTIEELKGYEYKLYQPEPTITELTLAEVSERLGVAVGTLKITGV